VIGLGRWGSRAPFPGGDADLGTDAFVIALKTLFDPAAAGGLDATFELRLADDVFRLAVRDRKLTAARGPAEAPDVTIDADPGALAAVLWHGAPIDGIAVQGDAALFRLFRALFPAPVPA
jgi:hypothetical protein